MPAASLGEVFREVGRGADYGVVPVEEASEGLVTHALDYFIDSDLLIVGEIVIEAAHALLTHTGQTAGVERVFAHPVAAARCAAGLVEAVGGAAWWRPRRPRPRRRWRARICTRAALAPALAAELFDLVGGPAAPRRRARRRRALPGARAATAAPDRQRRDQPALGLDDKPGRLAEVLNRLAAAGLNLRRIASRPTDRRGLRDLFFVDLDGHRDDPGCQAALDAAGGGAAAAEGAGIVPARSPAASTSEAAVSAQRRWSGPPLGRMAVIGVGQIGGSVALGARVAGAVTEVVAWSRTRDKLERAQALGIIDRAARSTAEAARGAGGRRARDAGAQPGRRGGGDRQGAGRQRAGVRRRQRQGRGDRLRRAEAAARRVRAPAIRSPAPSASVRTPPARCCSRESVA